MSFNLCSAPRQDQLQLFNSHLRLVYNDRRLKTSIGTYSKAELFYTRQVSLIVSLNHHHCNKVLPFTKSTVTELLSSFASTFYAFEDHCSISVIFPQQSQLPQSTSGVMFLRSVIIHGTLFSFLSS